MKVLRKGDRENWTWIGKCCCGAIIEADVGEMEGNHIHTAISVAECLECGYRMVFHRSTSAIGKNILEVSK